MTEDKLTNDKRPLAAAIAVITALYAVVFRLIPYDVQAYCLWPFGALALYGGARLRWWQALGLIFLVQAGVDVAFYLINRWEIPAPTYVAFAAYVLLGVLIRPLLSRHWLIAATGIGGAAVLGYALFFFITNTAAWLTNARAYYEPHTLATLLQSYREGLEFIRARPGQAFGNIVCVGLVFGLHALLARSYFPAERFDAERAR